MSIWYTWYMYHHTISSTLSTSQSERITMIPSPLTSNNLSTHSCWLWTHDVSRVMSIPYPIALQGYPIHFIVMYMYRPQSSHSAVWIYQSLILKIYVMWFAILNDAPPYQSIGWIPSRNKIYYPHTSVYTRRMYNTNRWIIWIVAIHSYYIFVVSILSYIIHYELYVLH